ncbi:pth11-like integral membrane protein [Grosmannia clavigera kw1407]|uniref:Pth11-like integral membrane protein n=1 Tax=Grosmannia clavigera (strain kw1407 / UAMH 11150) TaxID=655863 RepID=F0XKX8_GROCL|nr:pth11-like integral membrane protein [Grosmannia clavigera kw1407]EFX01666.1 pth11-like integral membrane protein [Grosmannia clavigera kw1407]
MSNTKCPLGDFGPAPDGLDLCANKNATIIGPVVVVLVISFGAVAVRISCRYSIARKNSRGFLAVDDYLVIAALIMAVSMGICCFIGVQFGGGQHLWAITVSKFDDLWKTLFAFILIYVAGVSLTKASIMLFYRRLFGSSTAWWVVFTLIGGYFVAITVTALAACQPLSYFWGKYTDPNATGSCIDTPKFFLINGICAMLIDVLILVVPLPTIYGLNMPPGKKAMVSGILLLGSFVVRIIALDHFTKDEDVVWAMAEVFVWSCCEPCVGIVCACLPTYGPLFARFKWFRQVSYKASFPPTGKGAERSNVLITIGGSRQPATTGNVTTKSSGWSRLTRGNDTSKQSSVFRSRPDEDEVELTTNIQGSKRPERDAYGAHVDEIARSTTQASDSDGDEQKNMQVLVKTDVRWEVESRK